MTMKAGHVPSVYDFVSLPVIFQECDFNYLYFLDWEKPLIPILGKMKKKKDNQNYRDINLI